MQAHFLWPVLKRKAFSLRLNTGSSFLQSAFWIWIAKRFSLVRECNAFLQCLITLGPARQFSLRIVIYRSKITRMKCSLNWSFINLLWRIELWLSKTQHSVFLKIVRVFWLERVVPPLIIALNKLYSPHCSFKIFPRFWLAESPRLIHHNQLLMTKFVSILTLTRNWRQKFSVFAG